MTELTVAVWLALAASGVAAILASLAVVRPGLDGAARRATRWALALVSLPLGILAVSLLAGTLEFYYVWQHIDQAYPWWLRLAGLWGGPAGTLLLWAWIVLAATVIESRWAEPGLWPPVRATLLIIATLLLVAPVVLDLGAATPSYGLIEDRFVQASSPVSPTDVRPQGEGLNPLLESPYMAIHPWIQFLGYGLAALPFAYAITHLFTGQRYEQAALRWARPAWLALLSAMTLGALWAYEVLSFGGYWVWDPVEIGNLLPLLSLTVFLHARANRGELGLLAPVAAAGGLVLIVFATFVTRSGLWSSVHAFLPTGASVALDDPGARLGIAVAESWQAGFATGLLILALGVTMAGVWAVHARRVEGQRSEVVYHGLALVYAGIGLAGLLAPEGTVGLLHALLLGLGLGEPLVGIAGLMVLAAAPLIVALAASETEASTSPRTRPGQLTLAAVLLSLTLVATLVLLVLGVNGYDASVFEARAPFLAGAILALIATAFLPGRWPRTGLWAGGALVLGLALRVWLGSWAWAAVPICLVSAAGPAWLMVQRAHPGADKRGVARGVLLVASGVLAIVHWAWPGSILLAGTSYGWPAWYVPVGLAAGTITLLSPMLEARTRAPWWLGGVAGVLGVGYALGALLAVGSLAIAWGGVAGPRPSVRKAGVPLIHVGLVVTVLGVALSGYASTLVAFPQDDPLVRGEPRTVGAYEVELVSGEAIDANEDERAERLTATIHVRKNGVFVSEETLELEHSRNAGLTGRGGYVPQASPITRLWQEDVAHNADTSTPLSIAVAHGNRTWAVANAAPPHHVHGEVDAISMGIRILPGTGLVWAGAYLALLGAGLRMRGS